MNKVALKIALSPLVLGVAVVGCSTAQNSQGSMFQPVAASAQEARQDQRASERYELARQSLEAGDTAGALAHAERAVELSPRDAGYRMLLGEIYLKNGRFASAETAFADVLALNPGNSRATFNLVLSEIALGKAASALVKLDRLSQTASAGDVGLAYALAGQPDRAVAMLEPAAREHGADGRVRQNLALAYALSGDWQRARVVAAQDLSPADLAGRMQQWATFVQPTAQPDQVATLLGVTPASSDAGQPVRLALAPTMPEPVAYAQADVQPAAEAAAEAPAAYAEAHIPVQVQPVTRAEIAPAPQPAVMHASLPASNFAPAPVKRLVQPERSAGTGRFVVQLAAYGSAGALETGSTRLQKRYGLGNQTLVSATVTLPGKGRFHRLSMGGFGTQAEAARACASIKGKGGACFVRPTSGDAPLQWAWRNARKG